MSGNSRLPSTAAMITICKAKLNLDDFGLASLIHVSAGIISQVEGNAAQLTGDGYGLLEKLYYGEKLDRQSLLK